MTLFRGVNYAVLAQEAADAAIEAAVQAGQAAADAAQATLFTQTGDGAAERTALVKARDTFSVKDFMEGATAEDDTAALEAAFNEALRTGRRVFLPHDRDLWITRTINVRVPNDAPLEPAPSGAGLWFHDTRPLQVVVQGGRRIKAAPGFVGDCMVKVTYNSDTGSVAPMGTSFYDMYLDGNNIVDVGFMSDWCGIVELHRCRVVNCNIGMKWHGYGGAVITNANIKCPVGIDFTDGGGDSWILRSSFYCESIAINMGYLGGNTCVQDNVFNRQDEDVNPASLPIGVSFTGSLEMRNVRILNNEFCGMYVAVDMVGTGTLNVKKINIIGNHVTPSAGGGVWSGVLARLIQARECIIANNHVGFGGYITLATGGNAGVYLENCQDMVVQGNEFQDLQHSALFASNVVGMTVQGNIARNCDRAMSHGAFFNVWNVTDSMITGNVGIRDVGTGNFLVEATGSTRNKGVNQLRGFANNYVLAGGSTSSYS